MWTRRTERSEAVEVLNSHLCCRGPGSARERVRESQSNVPLGECCGRFAIVLWRTGWMERDHDLDAPEPEGLPEMRHEIHFPEPSEQRSVTALERKSIETAVANREWLHGHSPSTLERGQGEHAGTKFPHVVATSGGALRKDDDVISGLKAFGKIPGMPGTVRATSIDEDASLQAREPAEEGPAFDLLFGNE